MKSAGARKSVRRAQRARPRASDRHEAQAHDAGRRFARGERGLGRGLTPAATAGFSSPASVGEPLAPTLREQLEQSFDAGLGAIRIHRDAPARQAAAQFGADAFASGTHIYFSAGRYAPESAPGRTLLGHEIAHVLQQSRRASSRGRMEARAVSGAGEVQCWTSPLPSSDERRSDVDLMAEHLAGATASSADAAVISRLMVECSSPTTGGATFWSNRALFVMGAQQDPILGDTPQAVSSAIASALYDGLKISGFTVAAARLLHERHDLQTLFFSAETYERYLADYGGSDLAAVKPRFYEHWNRAEWFGNGTPRFMLDRVMIYLIGPSAISRPLAVRDGELTDQANAELLRRHAGTLGPDELYYVTVLVARQLEVVRLAMLERARQLVEAQPDFDPHDRDSIKLWISRAVRKICTEAIENRDTLLATNLADPASVLSQEALYVWLDDLGPALVDIAEYAIQFFEFNERVSESLRTGDPVQGTAVVTRDVLANIDRDLPGYRAQLERFLHAVLDRNADGSLPQPQDFARRRDAAARRLDRELFVILERPLADRLFAGFPTGSPAQRGFGFDAAAADRELPMASRVLFLWAIATANDLRSRATRGYSRSLDDTLIARQRTVDPAAPATDLREIFRIRLAEYALAVALSAGWTGWAEWVRPIIEGGEIRRPGDAGATDYVAFGADWMLDTEVSVAQMRFDLPGQIERLEPLTTNDLVEFYLTIEYRTLIEHIDRLLGINRAIYTLGNDPVINQAFDDAMAESHPERYLITDWEWVTPMSVTAGRTERAPRVDVRQLIAAHPFTEALVQEIDVVATAEMIGATAVTTVNNSPAAVYWSIPTPIDLVARIQRIPAVSQLILDALPVLVALLPSMLDPGSTLTMAERADLQALVARIESGGGFDPDIATPPPATPLSGLTLDALMALEWNVWWDLWRNVLGVQSGARQTSLLNDIASAFRDIGLTATLHRERKQAFEDALAAQRRALAHERRLRIETQLRPTLAAFDPYDEDEFRVPGSNERGRERDLAELTVDMLEQFVFDLPDLEEREGHLALAVLELSDTLLAQLGSRSELNNIHAWVPYLDRALVWANDATKGGNAAVRDGFTVEEERGNAALFGQRRAAVETLLIHMADVLQQHFMEWGVVGVRGDGTLESPGHAHPVGDPHRTVSRGTAFTIDGRTWEILEVKENFVFHPGSFELRSMRNRAVAGSKLYIGDGTPGPDDYLDEGARPHTLLMRVMLNEGPEVIDVYADDDSDILRELTWALHMHATLEQLGELADAIETAVNVGMDIAELFPGGGQALAAARLLSNAIVFLGHEGPELIRELVTNPTARLEALGTQLQSLLSLDNIIGFLLFSNASFDGLIREPRASGANRYRSGGSRRLRRLLRKVQSFGRNMGQIFVRVHGAVQDRRQQVEHTVQNRPGLVRLVQIVADFYLLALSYADYRNQIDDLPAAIGEFTANIGDFPTKINEMIAGMGQITFPADILPREALVDVLLDVIGNRMGGKYKLGVRVLMQLLDFIGARDQIVQIVADLLRDAGVTTPNLFPQWATITDSVGEFLQDAQQSLQRTLNSTFEEFGAPIGLAPPQANVVREGEDFPEESLEASPLLEDELRRSFAGQAQGSIGDAPAARLLERIAGESGEALLPQARMQAEARFGEDFSHVRVHQGTPARTLTRSVGARALTSGSHVILGEGAGGGASPGPVLYHELAHVVQQTGSRPAGSAPRSPRTGRSRRGIRHDARMEAAADSAAAAAMRGATAARPLSISDEGWQPNATVELYGQQFLRQLVDVATIEEEVTAIDVSNATTGPRLIGRDVKNAVSHVAQNLRGRFGTGANGLVTDSGTYRDVRREISAHLLNAASFNDISEAIEDIAIRASFEAEPGRDGRPPRMQLDIADFTRRLERYVFGKTGVMLDLEFNPRGLGRDATFTSSTNPYDRARVKYVFLANVHGNTGLWRAAISHHTAGTTAAPVLTAISTQAEQGEWRTQIRGVLRDLGPSASVWLPTAFHFTPAIFAAAQQLRDERAIASAAGTLPANQLPSVAEYLNTAGTAHTGDYKNLRIHLGKYNQKGAEQSGKERESHHITQYLMVEYFHNGKTGSPESNQNRMAFPLLASQADAYGSDLETSSSRVPLRYRDVQIHELENGQGTRGGGMPTILLARPTHRRGNLHLSPRAEDFSDAEVSTQSEVVNHIYKNALGAEMRDLQSAVVEGSRPYSAWVSYRDDAANNVPDRIYNAMQSTYKAICKYMQPRLRSALVSIEAEYYNDLYAQTHTTVTEGPITDGQMNDIADKAVRHNDQGLNGVRGLNSYGWHIT